MSDSDGSIFLFDIKTGLATPPIIFTFNHTSLLKQISQEINCKIEYYF